MAAHFTHATVACGMRLSLRMGDATSCGELSLGRSRAHFARQRAVGRFGRYSAVRVLLRTQSSCFGLRADHLTYSGATRRAHAVRRCAALGARDVCSGNQSIATSGVRPQRGQEPLRNPRDPASRSGPISHWHRRRSVKRDGHGPDAVPCSGKEIPMNAVLRSAQMARSGFPAAIDGGDCDGTAVTRFEELVARARCSRRSSGRAWSRRGGDDPPPGDPRALQTKLLGISRGGTVRRSRTWSGPSSAAARRHERWRFSRRRAMLEKATGRRSVGEPWVVGAGARYRARPLPPILLDYLSSAQIVDTCSTTHGSPTDPSAVPSPTSPRRRENAAARAAAGGTGPTHSARPTSPPANTAAAWSKRRRSPVDRRPPRRTTPDPARRREHLARRPALNPHRRPVTNPLLEAPGNPDPPAISTLRNTRSWNLLPATHARSLPVS